MTALLIIAVFFMQLGLPAFSQVEKAESAKKVALSSKEENGLNQITFATANGNVVAVLPAEIVPNDNIWGTAILFPSGRQAQDRKNNLNVLKKMLVQVKPTNGDPIILAPGCSPKVLHVPNNCSEIQVSLYDPADKTMNTFIVDCVDRPSSTTADGKVAMPQVATPKRYFPCGANTDGTPGKAGCTIGGENCPAVAGSPRNQWFSTPNDLPAGQSPIRVYLPDKNQVAESQISVVRPKIYADKLLHVGDRGQIKITVDGLKPGMDAQLIFRNLSPDVISVDGGDYQVIPLSSSR